MKLKNCLVLLGILSSTVLFAAHNGKIVIAHRGASGYLPEHTLESKALAFAQQADYLEQDLAMSKDGRLIVIHDHFLDGLTDVAKKFPNRKRTDGRYYVIDFTWAELQTLEMTENFTTKDGIQEAVYPNRFPLWKSDFKLHTFEDEIEIAMFLYVCISSKNNEYNFLIMDREEILNTILKLDLNFLTIGEVASFILRTKKYLWRGLDLEEVKKDEEIKDFLIALDDEMEKMEVKERIISRFRLETLKNIMEKLRKAYIIRRTIKALNKKDTILEIEKEIIDINQTNLANFWKDIKDGK